MSGIAKPLVHFTGATTNSQKYFANVDNIQSAEPLDQPALPNQPASTAKYYIVITSVRPNGQTKELKVEFASSSARNTSLTNLKAAISTAIA